MASVGASTIGSVDALCRWRDAVVGASSGPERLLRAHTIRSSGHDPDAATMLLSSRYVCAEARMGRACPAKARYQSRAYAFRSRSFLCGNAVRGTLWRRLGAP